LTDEYQDEVDPRMDIGKITDQTVMRMFAIMGGSVFTTGTRPLSDVHFPKGIMTVGLDIETSMVSDDRLATGMPAPGCEILMCSIVIPPREGEAKYVVKTVHVKPYDNDVLAIRLRSLPFAKSLTLYRVACSADLVSLVIRIVRKISPDFVAVHNGTDTRSTPPEWQHMPTVLMSLCSSSGGWATQGLER
jgi:hypothetical protein